MRTIDHGTRQYTHNEDGDDNNIMSLTHVTVKPYTLSRWAIVCTGGSTNVRPMKMAMAVAVSKPILTLFHPPPKIVSNIVP
jgi:hypothetical protein